MDENNRKGLNEQLRALAAGGGDGIDLDSPWHWVIEDIKQPVPFFDHLAKLLPFDSILYIEGTSIAPDLTAFYSFHRASNVVNVARDTIFPIPAIHHVTFSADVLAKLRNFAGNRASTEIFDHIKAYRGETLLFTFHDAFEGWLLISEHLPDQNVARFCEALGVSRRREETKRRDPEEIRRFLGALEDSNPMNIRFEGERWWSRLWRWWT